jgi:hypothetical protein
MTMNPESEPKDATDAAAIGDEALDGEPERDDARALLDRIRADAADAIKPGTGSAES